MPLDANIRVQPDEVGVGEEFLVDASETEGEDKLTIRIEGQMICHGQSGCYHFVGTPGVYKLTVKAEAEYMFWSKETITDKESVYVLVKE